jgi:hypothetical protein
MVLVRKKREKRKYIINGFSAFALFALFADR